MSQPAAVCETLLTTGQQCGVAAIGRCTTCGRAFCQTHQARGKVYGGSVPYVDLCANCFAQTPEEVARRKAEEEYVVVQALRRYFYSGAARTDLLKSGVQPVDLYRTSREWQAKKGLFGMGKGEYVEVRTPLVRGWILGPFKWRWKYPEQPSAEGECVTAVLDVDRKNPGDFSYFGNSEGLVRVEGSPGAYRFIGAEGEFLGSWEEVVQTAKRLAGVTS